MSIWSIAGFTNLGYHFHARTFGAGELPMDDQTVVITGSTGGLGLSAARRLGELGADVVLVGRSAQRLADAAAIVPGSVRRYVADLSLLAEVRSLAEALHDDLERIDVLVNNVGVLLPTREVTTEGLEKTFATDLAGHFLLTNLLVPRLIESAPSRIVNVSSGGMYSAKLRPGDLQSSHGEYRGAAAYAHAKRGQVVLTEMWAERLAGTGISVHAMHPGWAATPGVSHSLPVFNRVMRPLLRTPDQGADTIVWLASAPLPDGSSGTFWFDRRPAPTHLSDATCEGESVRARFWQELVAVTGTDLELEGAAS